MLPFGTKSDYANVDDITPEEANNIGLNLLALGRKIQQVGDDVWVTTNADYNGSQWVRLDIAKPATAVRIGVATPPSDRSIIHLKAPAGSNPIVWTEIPVLTARHGTLTFTDVAATSQGIEQAVTHLLGTDDVMVVFWGRGSVSSGAYTCRAIRPDLATMSITGTIGNTGLPGVTAPAAGDVHFNVYNTSGSIQTITIHYSILPRN